MTSPGLPYGWWRSANFWAFLLIWPPTVALLTFLLVAWWL